MTSASFPPASGEQWRRLVGAVLDRAGIAYPEDEPEAALTGHTDEGLPVRALYTAADVAGAGESETPEESASPPAEPADAGWDVRQRHGGTDPGEVNRAVLADLEHGVTSIWLVLDDLGAGDRDLATLDRVLAGVRLDAAPVALDAGPRTSAAGTALLQLIADRGVDPAEVRGTLGADPIGLGLRRGTPPDLAAAVAALGQVRDLPRLRAVTADGTIVHDAGAGEADELAVVTSTAVAYLRAGLDAGVDVRAVVAAIGFRLAVTDDQFLSMAKLRAARRIWARVTELSGLPAPARVQHQHAVTSAAMITRRDPWVNLVRTTVAAFAAIAAGADAITVVPFDSAVGASDAFARRIARNTHAVLRDEAGLARVADPGGGSWYVESLTTELAEAAWDRFTALERAGGARNARAVAELIGRTRDRRDEAIATGRRPITGVSTFPHLAEVPLARPPRRAEPAGSGAGLAARRYAEPFESQRDRSDSVLAATGRRPRVFLAVPGAEATSPAARRAAGWFATGGIDTTLAHGTPRALAAAFGASGALVACVCAPGDDADGLPGPEAGALTAAGAELVDARPGCDIPAVLRHTLDLIEARTAGVRASHGRQ